MEQILLQLWLFGVLHRDRLQSPLVPLRTIPSDLSQLLYVMLLPGPSFCTFRIPFGALSDLA